jgi:hypothetical protein
MPVAYTPPGQPAVPDAAIGVPTAPAARPGGSNKGLIFGLSAAAGVLAIVGIIVAVRSTRPKDDVVITSPFGTGTAPGIASSPAPETIPSMTALPIPSAAQPSVTVAPTAKKPAIPKGDGACLEARKQADNGDVSDAARYYASCEGPNQATAKSAIARAAPEAVKRKVFNGDCAGARAALAAAKSIGAAGNAEAVLAGSKCK